MRDNVLSTGGIGDELKLEPEQGLGRGRLKLCEEPEEGFSKQGSKTVRSLGLGSGVGVCERRLSTEEPLNELGEVLR
jgi:hypothetical protein